MVLVDEVIPAVPLQILKGSESKPEEDSIRGRNTTPRPRTAAKQDSVPQPEATVAKQVSYTHPPLLHVETKLSDHMSGLLLSGSLRNTCIEFAFIIALLLLPDSLNVPGSMPARHLGYFMILTSAVTRVYNSYLEAVYFAFPKYRTQPAKDHILIQEKKDLTGRDAEQQHTLEFHDMMTVITGQTLNVALYFLVPGFYPDPAAEGDALPWRALRLVANHYIMSFGMYWSHRALHVVPFLWKHIHSIHHYARTPLSRVTYEDHWADNFGNAIVGQTCAQILVPLDYPTFVFSRVWRILESLEKHSGHSSNFNLAHAAQYAWMPFAQMPHHHDWHHEGHKSCNFTFSSLGGLWDCLFGTRKAGRAKSDEVVQQWATRRDKEGDKLRPRSWMDKPTFVLLPVFAVVIAAVFKLQAIGWAITR